MFARFIVLSLFFTGAFAATAVKKCSGNKPFPLEVRVYGCEIPPCIVIKDTILELDIDFVSYNYSSEITTMVKATTLGITVPYELPEDVRNVCKNLMYGAYCPLYPEEDVTYKFLFHIGNYPEISVKIEIYLVNQVKEIITCFVCDIKVRKGNTETKKSRLELEDQG